MIRSLSFWIALVFATLASLVAAPVSAQRFSQSSGSSLSDGEIDRRLRFLEQRLDGSKLHGEIWHWGWLAVNGGSAIGFGAAAAASSDGDDTVKHSVTAAKAAIGVGRVLFEPLEARKGADPIRGLAEGTREQKLAKLRAAEDQLQRNAERAEKRWSWPRHLGNTVLNAAGGGIVAAFGDTGDAYEVGVVGFLGGLAFILTQPWEPEEDWEDYKRLTGAQSRDVDIDLFVTALPDGGAINFRLSW